MLTTKRCGGIIYNYLRIHEDAHYPECNCQLNNKYPVHFSDKSLNKRKSYSNKWKVTITHDG